jgi:hypothetical protein
MSPALFDFSSSDVHLDVSWNKKHIATDCRNTDCRCCGLLVAVGTRPAAANAGHQNQGCFSDEVVIIMAHQLPNVVSTAVNVLGTSGLLAARPAGQQRSREAAPDPIAAPPAAAELGVSSSCCWTGFLT